jgi:hypothetical protein
VDLLEVNGRLLANSVVLDKFSAIALQHINIADNLADYDLYFTEVNIAHF